MISRLNDFSGEHGVHCPFCGSRFLWTENMTCPHLAYVVGEGVAMWAAQEIEQQIPEILEISSRNQPLTILRAAMRSAQNFVEFEIVTGSDITRIAFTADWDHWRRLQQKRRRP